MHNQTCVKRERARERERERERESERERERERENNITSSGSLTSYSYALFLVASIPGFELTSLAAVEHLLASRARSQAHAHRTPAVITVLEQRLPEQRDRQQVSH